MRHYKKRINAFTLVELMVTIAIATILISIAIPSFTVFYEDSRSEAAIRNIQQSLQLARNQAISYGARVTVCPLSGTTCGDDWENGFKVFIDNGTIAKLDSTNGVDDKVIIVVDPFHSSDFVSYDRNSISFSSEGSITGTYTSGIFSYCPTSKSNENTKAIEVTRTGRMKLSTNTLTCS
ncbi:general secretion pathway protein GspH [Shewanella sp. GutCb]|uniref:GspH/FimT family pseudopilin n=1 Tax=Shewanella sp. GutCb TaxID=2058315 RepID=UPI000C7AD58E|nr:GspH/FimT family pseudopilin [Shewanella sp. GutCb]PKG76412.1 general secretion pathway protein GspH [Shewanella sp. GutCb]